MVNFEVNNRVLFVYGNRNYFGVVTRKIPHFGIQVQWDSRTTSNMPYHELKVLKLVDVDSRHNLSV
jgi:hypothetical protein